MIYVIVTQEPNTNLFGQLSGRRYVKSYCTGGNSFSEDIRQAVFFSTQAAAEGEALLMNVRYPELFSRLYIEPLEKQP